MWANKSGDVTSEILEKIRLLLPRENAVFLVGGAVRDLLLRKSAHDLDFAVSGNAARIARTIADKLGGGYYQLDDQHGGGRVVLMGDETSPNNEPFILDFFPFQGETLDDDLCGRDFTINAMALSLHQPDQLIDPLGGLADLNHKVLRVCSETSIQDDPIRALRAVRQSVGKKLKIEPNTSKLVREAANLLSTVSAERIRDELFRILDGPQPGTSLRMLDIFGLLDPILPELTPLKGVEQTAPHIYDVWEHTLQTINNLEMLLNHLATPGYNSASANNLAVGLAVMRLGRYREQFHTHISLRQVPWRPWKAHLFFAALYHDVGKPGTRSVTEGGKVHFLRHETVGAELIEKRANALRLSNQEIKRLAAIVTHHMRIHHLVKGHLPVSRRSIYRFFRKTGLAGIDVCLLNLADVLATYGTTLPTGTWASYLDVQRTLLEAYWEKPEESVQPPRLVDGRLIMEIFQIEPGRIIGEILAHIEEAQAVGEISTREGALQLAQEILNKQP